MLMKFPGKIDSIYHTCLTTILFILSLMGLICPSITSGQNIRFRDVTQEKKVPGWVSKGVSILGHGAFWTDISGDSLPDLYISSAVREAYGKVPETLYISHADAAYTEEDGARGVSDSYGMTGSHGVLFADYDNDGDLDFFNATTDDRTRLYRNKGNGTFEDYSNAANLKGPRVTYPTYGEIGLGTRGIVAFDADNDGDLDLYATNWGPVEDKNLKAWETPPQPNEFYINNGDGTFTLSQDRGCTPVNPSNEGTQGVTAVDVDEDGDMDLFVCHRNYAFLGNDELGNPIFGAGATPTPNDLFINDGTGHFTEANARERGLHSDSNDINGTTFADYDNDGDLDAFVVHTEEVKQYVRLYRNKGNGFFTRTGVTAQIKQWGFTCFVFDIDNDADLDVVSLSTRDFGRVYLNDGAGNYTEQSGTGMEIPVYDPRGGSIADMEGDGDLDLYFVDANKDTNAAYSNRLFRNDTPNSNNWLKIWGSGPKGDLGAFGTKIWLYEKGGMEDTSQLVGYKQITNAYGYLAQDDLVQHFGLGTRDSVDVKIKMLDGTVLKTSLKAKTRFYFSRPNTITLLSGDNQTGQAGARLTNPLQVLVTDAKGKAVQGAAVQFAAVSGGGRFAQAQPVYTDARGIASAHYIVGNLAGAQQVTATLSGVTDGTVTFVITGVNPGPAVIELVSGSGQFAFAGQVLADSIRVRVSNSIGAPQSDHIVHFEILTGNGKIKPGDNLVADIPTNSRGMASVAWQLGPVAGTPQAMRITSEANDTPLAGSPIDIAATALERPIVAGPPADLLYLSGDRQSSGVNQLLPAPFVVQLVDSIGEPCENYDILFEVVLGTGTMDGATQKIIKTDVDGKAFIQFLNGKKAGVDNNRVRARYAPITREVYFAASAVADIPATLTKIDGDNQFGAQLQTLPKPLRVKITDTYGNAIPAHPVTFAMTSSDGWVNNVKTTTVSTDSSGHAAVLFKLGELPGVYQVSASSQYGNMALAGSPLSFMATAVSKPAILQLASVDSISGLAGQRLAIPLRVRVTDKAGYAVANHPVTFLVRRGGGSFDNQPEVLKLTDQNGVVSVTPTLGQAIGKYNNVFEAQSYQEAGQPLTSSPIRFYVTAKKSLAAKMYRAGGQDLSGQAGEFLTQPLAVRIVDNLEQSVPGQDVLFEVSKGSGLLGVGQTAKVIVQSNSSGVAQIAYRLGNEIGANSQTVRASANDGVDILLNSPILFTASTPYGQPDSTVSRVTATTPVAADGVSESQIAIEVKDSAGHPVPGEWIAFLVSGDGNSITPPEMPTDAQGRASAILRSTVAGKKQCRIYLTDKKIYLQQKPQIEFVAGNAHKLVTVSGDYQSGIINSALEKPLLLRAEDFYGNPVPNSVLYVEIPSGNGAVIPPMDLSTNDQGIAQLTWILGAKAGQQQILARVAGTSVTRTLTATAALPSKINLLRYAGEGQFAVPGGIFGDSLTVKVVDATGAAISGVDVTFAIMQGSAQVSAASAVRSDQFGLARTRLSAGYTIGAVKIRAMVQADIYVDFNAAVSTSVPERLTMIYGDSLRDRVAMTIYPLTVKVSDFFSNPVANVPVTFTTNDVGTTVLDDQPMYTDNEGLVSARVRLGTSVGPVTVLARNNNLQGSPLVFNLFADAGTPQNLVIFDGDQQSARAMSPLSNPIRTKVIDQYGNGVPNQVVEFSVRAGGGQVYPIVLLTDITGVAASRWTLGMDGTQEVAVKCTALPGIQRIITAQLIPNLAPVIRCISDTTISETHTLVFDVEAVDPDGGEATVQATNLPAGATFDALNSRLFVWRPDYKQQGNYTVTFSAKDNNGGETQKPVTIRVKNLNRPPAIYAFQPESFYLLAPTFKPCTFWVKAIDQDSDLLQYSWRLNGRLIGQKDSVTIFTGTTLPAAFTLVATVRDLADSVTQEWSVQQATAVAEREMLPQHSKLEQNYPNPFNPETTIRYELAKAQNIEMKLYNMSGQLVRTLYSGFAKPGYHQQRWDGRGDNGDLLPSGVYQCLLSGETVRQSIKLVFLK